MKDPKSFDADFHGGRKGKVKAIPFAGTPYSLDIIYSG